MIEYRLKLPLQRKLFDTSDLTFTINHIRSRRPSVMYFMFHCYTIDSQKSYDVETGEVQYSDEILIDDKPLYTSPRTVIGTSYGDEPSYTHSFTLPSTYVLDTKTRKVLEDTAYSMVEIVTLGIDSENPLYFNELMLQEGSKFNGYHEPSEMEKMNSHTIDLPSSMYANLYDGDMNYLQVIRPNKERFNTNNLMKAQYTILAPHFSEEDEVDSHMAVFYEAINQTEQRVDVLR